MSSKRLKRITNEIKDLEESKEILENSGVYFHYDDSDINTINVMLYGPEKTPYEKGFYFFEFTYPPNYPMEPPIAKYYTQGKVKNASGHLISVRFNPNLYTCGKVCLSMLNTWNGPGWVPTNTISNVIIAIQALVLNEEPLRNEPGFEFSDEKTIEKYSHFISYANLKIAVIDIMENTPSKFQFFKDKMKELFIKNFESYKNLISDNKEKLEKINNKMFVSTAYGMSITVDYDSLINELNKLYENIL
jgi:ubiquitin-conjugating enzyme E2 Z